MVPSLHNVAPQHCPPPPADPAKCVGELECSKVFPQSKAAIEKKIGKVPEDTFVYSTADQCFYFRPKNSVNLIPYIKHTLMSLPEGVLYYRIKAREDIQSKLNAFVEGQENPLECYYTRAPDQ